MKSTHWLAFAFAGVALVYGIHLVRHPETARAGAGDATTTQAQADKRLRPSAKPVGGWSAVPDGGNRDVSSDRPSILSRRAAEGAPAHRSSVLSESQWRARAAKVEMEANHELKRLVDLLDLDSYQQDRVFAALTQQARYGLPGTLTGNQPRVGGSVAASPSAAARPDVTDYLSADQQQTLIKDELDRQAWWEEVLPQLLPPPLQSDAIITAEPGSGSASDGSAGDSNTPPATKIFDGDGALVD